MESTFVQNIKNQIERLKEIVSSPYTVNEYINEAKNIHDSMVNDITEYMNISESQIVNDVVELAKPIIASYKTKAQSEVSKHTIKQNNVLNYTKPRNEYTIDVMDESMYDELYQNVDLTIDQNNLTKANRKTIKNFMECRNEILSEYDDLIDSIQRFEQHMVNRRQQLYNDAVNTILPQLYKSHLSYVKTQADSKRMKNAKPKEITIEVQNIQHTINQKQAEFMESMLKKSLSEA